ncbi:uncharacterized protein [Argopecten irradians]|uniref:uncharacterized protein n=1 Tax=Argopecten irradians TaxID=31199 RepID=UPI0037219A6A
MKKLTMCLEWMTFRLWYTILILFHGCWGCINTNLSECQLCSTQEDVPCKIQRLGYLCIPPIPDAVEAWPGTPHGLDAHIKDVGNGVYRAEFTWNAPYDSSINSLQGFLMMVHCEDKESIGLARCFHANLTDHTWADRGRAHDIKFKFTCVQSTKHVKVTLNLSSLPRPPKNIIRSGVTKSITLPGSRPKWNPLIDTEVKLGSDSSSSLKVRFQPLYPGAAAHHVILTKNSKSVNRSLIYAPENVVLFTHVPSNDNYTIWLRPVDGREQYIGDHFLESKPFNIPVVPQKRFVVTTGEPIRMDKSHVATVIVVPIVMLFTVTGTVIFFCRRRGKCQLLKSVPNSQTSEKLANDTPNNEQEITSQNANDQGITAVFCSQRNTKVEKVCNFFVQFIKSKTDVVILEHCSSELNTESYIHKWRTGQNACTLLILLSEELLEGVEMARRGLDILNMPNLKLDLHLLNLLIEIDSVTSAHLPPVMLVCVYSGLCSRFLELLPNLGQLYSIVDDIDQQKCQLRNSDLEQLFVSLTKGDLSHLVTLSHSTLNGCVQTKLLMAAIQELLNVRTRQSKTPFGLCNQPKPSEVGRKTYQCAYRPNDEARPTYIYRDSIRRGAPYCDDSFVRPTQPACWTGPPVNPRHFHETCVRTNSFPDKPVHTQFQSFLGQVDSGFDTMDTMTLYVGTEQAENSPFVVRPQITDAADIRMKERTQNGRGDDELALFISPESDDEYDGVSLSQRIIELNQRHTSQWNKP